MKAILSPVFFKELTQIANRGRTYAVRTAFMAAVFAFMAFFWLTFASDRGLAGGMSLTDSAELGHKLFASMAWTLFIGAAFMTPVFAANALTGEKEANTMGLLLLTRLRPLNIVQDKGLSRIAHMSQLILLCVPYLFICLVLGGVTTREILVALASVASVVLAGLGAGIFFSTVLSTFASALSASYLFMFVHLLIFPIFLGIFLQQFDEKGLIVAAFLSPGVGMVSVYETGMLSGSGMEIFRWAWTGPLATGILIYAFSVIASSRLLPRHAESQSAARKPGLAGILELSGFRALLRLPMLPFALLAEAADFRRRLGRNPVYWRESFIGKRHGRMALLYLQGGLGYLYLLCMILALVASEGEEDIIFQGTILMFVPAMAFYFLCVVVSSASSVTQEREEQTFDVLCSTALGTRGIVLGKLFGVMRAGLPCAAVPVALALICAAPWRWGANLPVTAAAIVLMIADAFWLASAGVFFSSVCGTTMKAVGSAVAFSLSMLVLPLVGYAAFESLMWGRASGAYQVFAALIPGGLPLTMIVGDFAHGPGDVTFPLGAMVTSLAIYAGTSYFFVAGAMRAIDRTAGVRRPGFVGRVLRPFRRALAREAGAG